MKDNYTKRLLSFNNTEDVKTPKVMVQVGQCSNSVGAQHILALLKSSNISADLIESGCDGLCFLAPKVILQYSDKTTSIFNNVSENDVEMISNEINSLKKKGMPIT